MTETPDSMSQIDIPLHRLTDICQRYEVSELAMFGSILRRDFHDNSDVDLLVEFKLKKCVVVKHMLHIRRPPA
jgi:predicted nucleotidyltransferase